MTLLVSACIVGYSPFSLMATMPALFYPLMNIAGLTGRCYTRSMHVSGDTAGAQEMNDRLPEFLSSRRALIGAIAVFTPAICLMEWSTSGDREPQSPYLGDFLECTAESWCRGLVCPLNLQYDECVGGVGFRPMMCKKG